MAVVENIEIEFWGIFFCTEAQIESLYFLIENTTKRFGRLDMLQTTFWLFFCWDILVSTRYEVGRKKLGQKMPNMLQTLQIKRPPHSIGLRGNRRNR